ncbi:hypothetical protein PHYSODRAFT_515823 [Phytophthora sojae]|uniref:Uncharacterized protein n=1 Tax=Phytophthora sojae (strain P6497) TaxID=1094619 RepID=G4ZWD6_PHYSP|nr:hypothetical protein PHYSODRAFT_515823 [Phytophthora sojae]EGZ12364.1 hypothetical protein PHYSODRAFT_515823 [Phytophthora sojae]|eukprot:XP_009532697.1 hypothetical protein PHYSODRAFT_515823 [Phytophthora sojae]
MAEKTSSDFVRLSRGSFAVWWGLILAVHVVTGAYNALYAYCYRKLQYTFLNLFLDALQIGMPPQYHSTIAIVHALMSAMHAACALLMVGGSLWQRSLCFTPWSSSSNVDSNTKQETSRGRSGILPRLYSMMVDRRGLCGVNGVHFHLVVACREILETALQTMQAYRMSALLPRILLNRFYVVLLAVNCWSSVIIYSKIFRSNEARRRFACIVLDCALDLMACMGVELLVVMSYASEYDRELEGFNNLIWYDDEWVACAINEFKMVLVVSWSDLASRAIFSLGLILATTNMKELVGRSPTTVRSTRSSAAIVPRPVLTLLRRSDSYRDAKIQSRWERVFLRTAHVLFAAWGIAVLGFHIHASLQPTLSQCLMQVRPWFATRPSCYLAGLDCHVLGISGALEEVESKWSEFDSSTVVQLLIRHCPAVEVPDIIGKFHALRGVKVYNSTIKDWGASAALTNANHPAMSSLFIVRVNMTDGLLPAGLQSTDFPRTVYDIEMCATNLIELPDDLDTKWPSGAIIQVEYSQLLSVPLALVKLQPYYLALTGNPITALPPEIFEVEGLLFLGISEMNINELPQNVTQLSSTLTSIYIGDTYISFFWRWADELVERMVTTPWFAARSTFCNEFVNIQNGTADSFSVPLSPEYSQSLMNSSEANLHAIWLAVDCDEWIEGLFYPIDTEDSINAISPAPALVRPK